MIKLRLQRKGRKKRPFYHIVVADSRSPRDGRIIERLGRFDNVSEKKELTYDEERIIHWLKIGAQPSDTVRNILRGEGILYKMHLMRWGKSDEEIETALNEWREAREAKSADDDASRKAKQKEILKAEEKEYKKQLEEKAAAAAKELEKKKEEEAKAAEEQTEESAEEKTEAAAEESTETATEEAEVKEEVKTEEVEEEKAEEAPAEEVEAKKAEKEKSEEAPEEESKADEKPEEAKVKEEPKAEEKKEEAKAEEKKEEPKAEASTVSTDMNATEAIDHIKNTDLKDLKGFVPKDEERVTVQRAWEAKQAE